MQKTLPRGWTAMLAALLAAALSACGGGGGDTGSESPAGTITPDCAALYAASPLSGIVASLTSVDTVPSLAKPRKGVAFLDPTYKSCVVRATDHTADGTQTFARNDYSRRQAFNADSTLQLVYAEDGFWHTYDAATHAHIAKLQGPAGDAEPQWHPANPKLLYFIPNFGIGMKLNELNVTTGSVRLVADFGPRLKAVWPTARSAWTHSEGSPSADARYWCFLVDNAADKSIGVFTWDRDTDTILGTLPLGASEAVDHVSMSPTGNHCVVSGDGPMGTTSFSRTLSQPVKLLKTSQHSDLALDANGDDQYVSIDYAANEGDVFMHNLRTNVRTTLFPTYLTGTSTALHVSGKAYAKPGWVVISTYGEQGSGGKWLHKKILAVQLAANPKIYNLAFHHSGGNGYWTTPVASVNRDFTKVVFNSNWETGSASDVDAYVVELPPGSF